MEKIKEMLKKYDCVLVGNKIKHKNGKYLQFTFEATLDPDRPYLSFEDRLFELLEKQIKDKIGEFNNV